MPRPATPVWAPNPGVPLTARILAYVFAALMLYTVISSCRNVRPPDIPPVPVRWHRYTSAPLQLQIPYPQGWIVVDKSSNDDTHLVLSLPPGNQVYIEVIGVKFQDIVTATTLQQINANFAEKLGKAFPGYMPADGAMGEVAEWHQFQARQTAAAESLAMTGAWVSRVHDNRLVYVIAMAPTAGWKPMQGIAGEVLKGMTF